MLCQSGLRTVAKLSHSALAKLSSKDLIDYAGQLQDQTGGGWTSTHWLVMLGVFILGVLLSPVISQNSESWLGKGSSKTPGGQGQAVPSVQPAAPRPNVAQPTPELPGAQAEVAVGSLPAQGQVKAPVTIVEFSDYQCPFCASFFKDTLTKVKQDYIDTGKVKLYLRDFPLTSIHPYAQKAAEAARCANEQNAFWKYHDKIFENQSQLNQDQLKKWAADLGLDLAKFNNCLDSDKYQTAVQEDLQAGTKAGVNGTPAFFINGRRITGAQPFENFQQVIDAALKESS